MALCQSNRVREELEAGFPGVEVRLRKIKTTGDKITDVPLARVGGKGLFVKEIEEALFRGEVHLAVHSMKDVPTHLPDGLHLAAITRREDPRDVAILRRAKRILDLPLGARIGTSSLRRQSQIRHLRPDFEIIPLRGNLDTRIQKLEKEGLDAVILAAAGVRRMGWEDRITEYLEPEVCLPAIGQGALGLECREEDGETNRMLEVFDHFETSRCVRAERALLSRLEGGCQVPIAALARIHRGGSPSEGVATETRPGSSEIMELVGLVASTDGNRIVRDSITGSPGEAEAMGVSLAERLLSKGADEILREIYR